MKYGITNQYKSTGSFGFIQVSAAQLRYEFFGLLRLPEHFLQLENCHLRKKHEDGGGIAPTVMISSHHKLLK